MRIKFSAAPVEFADLEAVINRSFKKRLKKIVDTSAATDGLLDSVVDDVVNWLDELVILKGPIGRIVDSFDHVLLKFTLKLLIRPILEQRINSLVD